MDTRVFQRVTHHTTTQHKTQHTATQQHDHNTSRKQRQRETETETEDGDRKRREEEERREEREEGRFIFSVVVRGHSHLMECFLLFIPSVTESVACLIGSRTIVL